jgi:hypothetical protein
LSAGTSYHYRVVAVNAGGSVSGADQGFTTGVPAPGATTLAASAVTTSGAVLNGTVNPNGFATGSYFEYGTTTAYGSKTATNNAGAGSSGVTVNAGLSGLSAGTAFHYRVVAVNAGGSVSGADQGFTTGVPAPSATTLAASAVTTSGAGLNGTVNPNGFATSSYFEYGTTTAYGSKSATNNVGAGSSGVAVNAGLSGLSAGTSYHYRVVAVNAGGSVSGADQGFTTGVPAPGATTLAASGVTTSGAVLNGTVNPNGFATGSYFEYGTTTAYGSKTATNSAGAGSSGVAVNAGLSGLGAGTSYHFRVVALNAGGSVNGADQGFTTGVPAPSATTLAASGVTTSGAGLNGTVNPNGFATSSYFEYGTTTAYGSQTATNNAGSGSSGVAVDANISGLPSGSTTHFRLVASGAGGMAIGADQVFTTIVPMPSSSAEVRMMGDGSMRMTFTGSAGATITVLGSSDPSVPMSGWTVMGVSVETSPGVFEFIDTGAASASMRFYGTRTE